MGEILASPVEMTERCPTRASWGGVWRGAGRGPRGGILWRSGRGAGAGARGRRAVAPGALRWHHSQTASHKGTSLFYKPVRRGDLEKTFLQADEPTVAAEDAAYYRRLALSKATRWDEIALNPFPVSR